MDDTKPTANIKAKLTEVNCYLTCPLCKGYYIDVTTIVECLHSFCRSCIIKHLQFNSYCPVCELMINTAKPNIKPDKTLQDIVYKLVPGLYASEMNRRRVFWSEHAEDAKKVTCPEARGHMTERIIFSPQDAISLSIEYTSDDQPDWNQNRNAKKPLTGIETDQEIQLRRYLQCPAMLRVEHLKKFICNKYSVDNQLYHVDILYKRVPLPDHYTLMDIAYIYSWKRNEPMKFFFRITDINLVSECFDYFEPSRFTTSEPPPPKKHPTSRRSKQHNAITANNNEKKTPARTPKIVRRNQCEILPKQSKLEAKKLPKESKVEKTLQELKVENVPKECWVKIVPKVGNDILKDSKNFVSSTNNKKDNNPKDSKELVKSAVIETKKDIIETNVSERNKSSTKETDSKSKCGVNKTDKKCENKTVVNKSDFEEKVNGLYDNEITVKIKHSPEVDSEKSQFLESIQLRAKTSSPEPTRKHIESSSPESRKSDSALLQTQQKKTEAKIHCIKRKLDQTPNVKSAKIRKHAHKSDSGKAKPTKTVVAAPSVSNIAKPDLCKTVPSQTVLAKPESSTDQNECLQSLIDSCKLNIPSSLSITLTDSNRSDDESKPATIIKPVQNYIEILKLPDINVDLQDGDKSPEDLLKPSKDLPKKVQPTQKYTFQTMFEETIKRNENAKAHLYQIQCQAKNAKIVKKPMAKKQQSNALDLSSKPSLNIPNPSSNKRNILEIAHQLHQNKRSKLDSPTDVQPPSSPLNPSQKTPVLKDHCQIHSTAKESPMKHSNTCQKGKSPQKHQSSSPKDPNLVSILKDPPISTHLTTKTVEVPVKHPSKGDSPPKQKSPSKNETQAKLSPKHIIINNNFNSGGFLSIQNSPPPLRKIPIPRLPVTKVPKLAPLTCKSPNYSRNGTEPTDLNPNQLLEKYNITNLAQFNANLNQLALQSALMMHHHRIHQHNNQKHWMNNPNILAQYESYVQSLKTQQNKN